MQAPGTRVGRCSLLGALTLLAAAAHPLPDAVAAYATLTGPPASSFGQSVAGIGDFDGDGVDDLAVAAPEAGQAGVTWVVLGRPGLRSLSLTDREAGVVRIASASSSLEGALGQSLAPAGDVNGDGLDDLVVTDPRAEPVQRKLRPRTFSSVDGAAYVVYGRRSPRAIDLDRLGRGGFVIRGIEEGSASGAGDVNGDGRADVVIAADDKPNGAAYVVMGSPQGRSFDVADLGSRGLTIQGAPGDLAPGGVASAGDVNGDGLGDVVIGAPTSLGMPVPPFSREPFGPGAAHVVLGRRSVGTVRLGRRGYGGFRIELPRGVFGFLGLAVAGAGDVDGDALDDVAVAAPALPLSAGPGPDGAGTVFVVPGSRQPRDLTLDTRSRNRYLEIAGDRGARYAGTAVDVSGDFDGDGRADVLVGAGDLEQGDSAVGRIFVISGRSAGARVKLPSVAPVFAGLPGDGAGSAVAAAGDPNADGRPDVIVGVPGACPTVGGAREVPLFAEGRGAVHLLTPSLGDRARPGPPGGGTSAGETLRGADGTDDCIAGLGGDDRLLGLGGEDSLDGGTGADRLLGGPDLDHLDGGRGDDRIQGGSGRDLIMGRSGADTLAGGSGGDMLFGAGGGDRMSGGNGRDHLEAGSGRDRLAGGHDRDVLLGDQGADLLLGDGGGDYLDGGNGRDVLEGGRGDDEVIGGGGLDRVRAGPGRDRLNSRDGLPEGVFCGPGLDRVLADPGDRLRGCERKLRRRRQLGF